LRKTEKREGKKSKGQEGNDVSEKQQNRVIELCVLTIQRELGEKVRIRPVVKESLAFFLKLPTLEAKIGYIHHLQQLAANNSAHLTRVFQILMIINASLEV